MVSAVAQEVADRAAPSDVLTDRGNNGNLQLQDVAQLSGLVLFSFATVLAVRVAWLTTEGATFVGSVAALALLWERVVSKFNE